MNLTKLAMRRPVSTALIVLALVVFGLTSVLSFRLELTPDMEMPMLLVYTIYPGADPESVEELVTKPVESAGAEQSGVKICPWLCSSMSMGQTWTRLTWIYRRRLIRRRRLCRRT